MATAGALTLAAVALLWLGVLLAFARPLRACWREPVLKHPVLIVESDDWGAGPLAQAGALRGLAELLQGVRDWTGRPAVMTLGVVLEVPDGPRIAASGCTQYAALSLADPRFDAVRAAMQEGAALGVFAPQLHGQAHYWPPAVLAAAESDADVRAWLTAPEPATTEALPSHLQSRWVDARQLPSRALGADVVARAVDEEVATYRSIFSVAPRVAVATTFVWTAEVERAWARAGIEVIVTPAHRATCRDGAGHPAGVDATMRSGDRSPAGALYLVRDVYFEPALGHMPQRLVDGLLQRTRQGRACLVETHRFNFLQAPAASLGALAAALAAARAACPDVRFLTPLELAHIQRTAVPEWVETRWRKRLVAWRARLDDVPRFRRVARLTGVEWPLAWIGARA